MIDDSGLSRSEAVEWDAIVAKEWPIESAILTTQLSSGSAQSGGADGAAEQRFVTVYQPRRPRLTPLTVGVLAVAASVWLTIQVLIPAYRGAGQGGISRAERAVEVHDLTIAAAYSSFALVVAVSCIGIWAASTARYMLRRSSCRLVASPSTPVTVHVRPPNPATAATWILLLLSVSTAAGWWIPLQLERTGGSPLDAIEALHLAGVGGLAWVAAFLLCAIGLTSWTVREARHRLRGQATDALRTHAGQPP